MKIQLLLLCIMSNVFIGLHAQDSSNHQWKERILIILTNKKSNGVFQKQIAHLKTNDEGLTERKMVVYLCTPETYLKGLHSANSWNTGNEMYRKYKTTNSDFEVILIGLDGGIKLMETTLVSTEKLFALIDSMPMRSSELRKQSEK